VKIKVETWKNNAAAVRELFIINVSLVESLTNKY
jgi:hypothetical protein